MYHLRLVNVIKYWLKVTAANPNRYIYLAYNVLLQDAVNGTSNWSSLVQNLLFKMSDAWNSQGVGNIKVFICVFKQRVRDINIPR